MLPDVNSPNSHPAGNSTFSPDEVLVIIPVLDEEETIAATVRSLRGLGLTQIRVVDNGSCDRSAIIAEEAGAEVLVEPIAGYGRACWRGLQAIPDPIRWILFCDGDGSDDLAELGQFWEAAPTADLILGDRRATREGRQAMTPVQNFGNGLAAFLIWAGWGHRYRDLGPLRLIRRSALEAIAMRDRGFGWTVEMQARAIELGLRVREIPVNYCRRRGGRSKISGTLSGSLRAGTVILSTLGRLYFRYRGDAVLTGFAALFLILGCLWMLPYGDFRAPGAVPQLGIGAGLMGVGFALSWGIGRIDALKFWAIALLTRLLLLPMYPGDDVWRYLWEGYIQNFGFSPYHFAPGAPELVPLQTPWWSLINHPDTSAIYPPVAQLGFRGLTAIAPSVLLFKLAFVSADLAVCCLLARRFGEQKTLIYAWNPLIIYSFAGGAHYDSWFILAVVAAWFWCDRRRWPGSAVAIGVGVAIKWMSLPLLGILAGLQWPRVRSILIIFGLGSLPLIWTAIPFCSGGECPLIPARSQFVSRGRSADFFPYFIETWGWNLPEGNSIYLLPLAAVLLVLLLWDFRKYGGKRSDLNARFLHLSESYFVALLLISPIIHAWYFTWLVPFSVATRNLGTRLVSCSAFVYFVLQYQKAMGSSSWWMSREDRLWMWLPFGVGLVWHWMPSRLKKLLPKSSV